MACVTRSLPYIRAGILGLYSLVLTTNLGILISSINRVSFSPAFASLVFLGAFGTYHFPAVAGPVSDGADVVNSVEFSNVLVAASATAPDLGTTSTFGVVSSTFTNTDAATIVNGDVCFTTGPGTSFTLNGTQTVPCSAMVGLDQASALANLNGQACTSLGAGCLLYTSDAADERSSVDLGG